MLPAPKAGVADYLRTIEELVGLIDRHPVSPAN